MITFISRPVLLKSNRKFANVVDKDTLIMLYACCVSAQYGPGQFFPIYFGVTVRTTVNSSREITVTFH